MNKRTIKITAIVIAAVFFLGICSGLAALFFV